MSIGKTAMDQARALGMTVTEVVALSGVNRATLYNWHKHKPVLFEVVLLGCKIKKNRLASED